MEHRHLDAFFLVPRVKWQRDVVYVDTALRGTHPHMGPMGDEESVFSSRPALHERQLAWGWTYDSHYARLPTKKRKTTV